MLEPSHSPILANFEYPLAGLALGVSGLHFDVRAEWASTVVDYRRLIRQGLRHKLHKLGFDHPEMEDLNSLPHTDNWEISISHSREGGGFVLAPRGVSVGLDIERVARVHTHLVARISSREELVEAPSTSSLWVAKEAGFKMLRGARQPRDLDEVEVGHWTCKGGLEFCRIRSIAGQTFSTENVGVVFEWKASKIGVFFCDERKQVRLKCVGS
jgi:hypothetical protein